MTIPGLDADVPWLDTAQMIEVDRAMIEDYRIDLVRMMENAGRGLAIVARERFLDGSPAGVMADLIRWANAQESPILALDAPSGIDTATGTVFDPAIEATATLTLALPGGGANLRVVRHRSAEVAKSTRRR